MRRLRHSTSLRPGPACLLLVAAKIYNPIFRVFALKEKIRESFHLPEWMCLRLFIFMKDIGTDPFCP